MFRMACAVKVALDSPPPQLICRSSQMFAQPGSTRGILIFVLLAVNPIIPGCLQADVTVKASLFLSRGSWLSSTCIPLNLSL